MKDSPEKSSGAAADSRVDLRHMTHGHSKTNGAIAAVEVKKEKEGVAVKKEKKEPLSLEELLAKKKAEEEAITKVRSKREIVCSTDSRKFAPQFYFHEKD